MSRSSQMVLARCSRAALLNSGFLNCIRGARSEYLGTRRFRAAGRAADDGALAGAGAAGTSVASGAGVASGLLGWMVWVMGPPMVQPHSRTCGPTTSTTIFGMRTHQLVLHWIEDRLSAGDLAVGGRLPAERALAEQLQVSRTSVREAIRILEAMGVVRSGVGSGPDAGTVVISDPTAALGSALRLHVATQHLPVADIVETRVLLESWAAARARADAPELEQAAALLDEMDAV